jgi:anti-anti-sigma factor
MSGELDMAREHELLDLVAMMNLEPDSLVEVDMRDVTFVDSAGLRSIVHTQTFLRGRCCDLVIKNAQRQLLRLVELAGLDEALDIYADED